MEYQKITCQTILKNEPFKFRTRNWFEINDKSGGMSKASTNQIKFKTSKIRSDLYDYSDASNEILNSKLFEPKIKITVNTTNNNLKNNEIVVPLKHLGNFSKTLQMSLFNCEISLILIWSKYFIISNFINPR